VQRLNYHHLLYFWTVAREGGLAPASKTLRLSPQTLSGQIRAFEKTVGHRLFTKSGRRLVLTEMGRVAFRYADEIFSLGYELGDVLTRGTTEEVQRLHVGLVEVLPKMVVRRLLRPALSIKPAVHLVCREGSREALIAELALHTLDVVIADEPAPGGGAVRTFSHPLGECGVTFFATRDLAQSQGSFPRSLDGAPVLLPTSNNAVRRQLDAYFTRNRVVPRVVGEFEDSALLKAFGRDGHGIFCGPSVVAREIADMYDVRPVGATDEVIERFFAISIERRIKHPAVVAISEAAKEELFR
jgi:LysR family transcriptional activator of nhaA